MAPLESGQTFALVSSDVRIPRVTDDILQRILSQAGCDGRPFASPLFRRVAGRGVFFRGFPFRWGLQIALSVVQCITMRMIRACCEDELLDVYARPGSEAADLFFTAVWLQGGWSILIQDVQPSRALDVTCHNALIGRWCTQSWNAQ